MNGDRKMNQIKGLAIKTIRNLFDAQTNKIEQQFISKLGIEQKKLWEHPPLPTVWASTDLLFHQEPSGTILYEAAQVLFPGECNHAMQNLGVASAKENVPVFFQMFIRIPTIHFVFKRVAMFWRANYDTGFAGVDIISKHEFAFVVKNYPQFPSCMRAFIAGYLQGMGELLRINIISVKKIEDDPQAWRWVVTWE